MRFHSTGSVFEWKLCFKSSAAGWLFQFRSSHPGPIRLAIANSPPGPRSQPPKQQPSARFKAVSILSGRRWRCSTRQHALNSLIGVCAPDAMTTKATQIWFRAFNFQRMQTDTTNLRFDLTFKTETKPAYYHGPTAGKWPYILGAPELMIRSMTSDTRVSQVTFGGVWIMLSFTELRPVIHHIGPGFMNSAISRSASQILIRSSHYWVASLAKLFCVWSTLRQPCYRQQNIFPISNIWSACPMHTDHARLLIVVRSIAQKIPSCRSRMCINYGR